jgi:hypothetical protein
VAQAVERLLCKGEALNLTTSPTKKKKSYIYYPIILTELKRTSEKELVVLVKPTDSQLLFLTVMGFELRACKAGTLPVD